MSIWFLLLPPNAIVRSDLTLTHLYSSAYVCMSHHAPYSMILALYLVLKPLGMVLQRYVVRVQTPIVLQRLNDLQAPLSSA